MGWIAGLVRGLWRVAQNSWVDVGLGLRPGSPAARLVTFLILMFFVIGLVLVLLGFDLDQVDRWLDSRASLFELIGTLAFKAVLAGILLVCAVVGGGVVFARFASGPEDRPGCASVLGLLLVALVLGYFCWVGLVNPL